MDINVIRSKWADITNHLQKEHNLTAVAFKTWIAPLSVYDVKDSVVYIKIGDPQFISYIKGKYTKPLIVSISEVTGYECDVSFIADPADEEPHDTAHVPVKKIKRIEGLNPRYTFDTFVVGNNNKFAHTASLAVAESPGEVYNPLFLYGGVGLGKTHLMHSIAHFIGEKRPDSNIIYVTSEQFTNEIIEAIRNGSNSAISKFREKYRNIDVLLVDDVQFIIGKESTQEEFFHTFNALHMAGKQIVISSDRPPKDMVTLEERIRSRFEWGLMADIQPPDYETRIAILQKKQELDGYTVSRDVIEYIASNVKANIRELEGSLNKVMALSMAEGTRVDLALAERALKDMFSPDPERKITPDIIIKKVSEYFNVSEDEIIGPKRDSKISNARQVAMYLIREMTNVTLEGIGKYFGNKHHSSVIYSVNKLENQLTESSELQKTIDNVKAFINKN